MYYSTLLLYYTASALIDQGYTCRGRVLVFQVRLKHLFPLVPGLAPFWCLNLLYKNLSATLGAFPLSPVTFSFTPVLACTDTIEI